VGSNNFRELIAAVRRNFDILIIDCPPTLPIADAAVIAKVADGVLMVVKAGKTRINQFRGAVATLTNVEAPIVGCVLNMIPTNRRAEEYGYRYGYSNYYGYKGKKNDKSLYSPEEPYGPAVAAMPQREAIDDFEELQEIRAELIQRTGVLGKFLSRGREVLLTRIARQIQELDALEAPITELNENRGEEERLGPGIERESRKSRRKAQSDEPREPQPAKSSRFAFAKRGSSARASEMPSVDRTPDDILEEIMRSIAAKEKQAAKRAASKTSPKKKAPAAKAPAKKAASRSKSPAKKTTAKKSAKKK
jgi:hypothetical protein